MKKHIEIEYENKILRGYLDYASKEDCVIVVHGIGGNKLGNKFIFKQFSDKANDANISTLRMDFAGSGESDGQFEQTNHIDQAKQLETIINYAKKVLGFHRVHLAGTSIGCLVILLTLKNHGNAADSISLWNPYIDINHFRNDYPITGENIDMNGLYLTSDYALHLQHIDIEADYSQANITILHGDKDFNFESKYVTDFINKNNCQYIVIDNGSHLFESNAAMKLLFEHTIQVIKATI